MNFERASLCTKAYLIFSVGWTHWKTEKKYSKSWKNRISDPKFGFENSKDLDWKVWKRLLKQPLPVAICSFWDWENSSRKWSGLEPPPKAKQTRREKFWRESEVNRHRKTLKNIFETEPKGRKSHLEKINEHRFSLIAFEPALECQTRLPLFRSSFKLRKSGKDLVKKWRSFFPKRQFWVDGESSNFCLFRIRFQPRSS